MAGPSRGLFIAGLAALASALTAAMPLHMRPKRGYGPRHTGGSGWRTIHRLNRSQNWRPAKSYKHARSISPYPDRPVR